jgi:myo-inositol-1(or 4)-monophosphatase
MRAARRRAARAGRTDDVERDAELLTLAEEAARVAAAELMSRFGGQVGGIRVKSTPTDLVSEADESAERAIRALLAQRRPDDAILGEEGGATGSGELRWIVDPLDGTINYLYGIPVFAVSIAVEDDQGTIAGVVLDPLRDECFAALRSGPATLNGTVIEYERRGDLSQAMVATGFSYDAAIRSRQAEVLQGLLPRVRDIRRAGAAAIDLAWCACGRYDCYFERALHNWDWAAGALIARRAGLEVRALAASATDAGGLAAAPLALIDEFMALVGP